MRFLPLTTTAGAIAALAGCTALVGDLGDFREDQAFCPPGGDAAALRDLDLHLLGMSAHASSFFEATVVSDESGLLTSRVIYDPLVEGNLDIRVPSAMPAGPHTLEIFADTDGDRTYTDHPPDHSWTRVSCDDGSLLFEHSI